ncbi:MAG: hypothetical protein PHX83_15135 [Acidobacteriia bacterium]|nr:hypothetical protein [Terriglobia bacterium]
MSSGAEVVAARAAAAIQAIKASGAIVRVEPEDFKNIVWKSEQPLVIMAEGGFLSREYQYLTSYKGLIFFTKSKLPLELGNRAELMTAKSIWTPN